MLQRAELTPGIALNYVLGLSYRESYPPFNQPLDFVSTLIVPAWQHWLTLVLVYMYTRTLIETHNILCCCCCSEGLMEVQRIFLSSKSAKTSHWQNVASSAKSLQHQGGLSSNSYYQIFPDYRLPFNQRPTWDTWFWFLLCLFALVFY